MVTNAQAEQDKTQVFTDTVQSYGSLILRCCVLFSRKDFDRDTLTAVDEHSPQNKI